MKQRVWKERTEKLPHNFAVAFAKYHAVILVMRLYEYIASQFLSEDTLDKLTLDTFQGAKRSAREGKKDLELGREMVGACWNANLIAFLADYSVHQVILLFGYYTYVRERRRRNRLLRSSDEGEDSEIESGPLVLSVFRKSTLLAITRGVGLGFSAVGGAIGSMILPGWGTLIGTNLGDGLATTLTDDMINSPPPV